MREEDAGMRIRCGDDESMTRAKKIHSERRSAMLDRIRPRGSGPQITRPSKKNT